MAVRTMRTPQRRRLGCVSAQLQPQRLSPTAAQLTPPDPYPDPGGYSGKATAFSPKEQLTEHTAPAAAGEPRVLCAGDHEHFLRFGYIHLRGAVPVASVAEALAFIGAEDGQHGAPPIDTTKVNAAVRELLGPSYSLVAQDSAGGYDMQRPHVTPTDTDLSGSVSDEVVTHGGAHCDDAYVTCMAQGWCLGSFIFLTPVPPRGGGFIVYPGSYLRFRNAVAQHGPGCLKGAAPRYAGELLEVLAEPGDVVLFHHLMGHSGSVNVDAAHTRHALLNRYHPTRRLEPLGSHEAMSTLERANSARYLSATFGVGRSLQPATPPASLAMPTMAQPPPPTTCFYLYGVFQVWSAVPGENTVRRWFSEDLTTWRAASEWAGLPPSAELPLSSLAFHHYELEAVLAVTDARGVCWLFESFPSQSEEPTIGGSWKPMPHTSGASQGDARADGTASHGFSQPESPGLRRRLQCVTPFNAYAGYPSQCAVGQCLYHTFADCPRELRCSWGGPAPRPGGNGPADGDWDPTIAELVSKSTSTSPLPASLDELASDGGEAGTSVALRTSHPIASFVAGARWGDSACSFVVDLLVAGAAQQLAPEAFYALPFDIAVCDAEKDGGPRLLENPDQLLPRSSAVPTALARQESNIKMVSQPQLHPLNEVSGDTCAAIWNVRPLSRARSFWLVSYLITVEEEQSEARVELRFGSIEWQEVPVVVRPIQTTRRFEDVLAIVGWR